MELYQLNYFVAVAETQHFTRAAEQLHISQPSLSKSISNLEAEFGVPLFERDKKNVYLTDYGRTLLVYAKRILSEADEARLVIADMAGNGSGDIRIGSPCVFTEPSGIDSYNRDVFLNTPGLSLHMYVMAYGEIEELLLHRKLDFGFSLAPSENPLIKSTLLFSYRLGLVVSKKHPLANRDSVRLSEFANDSFMCNNTSVDLKDSLYELCHKAGFEPHVVYEGESPDLIGTAVAAGRGVALISHDRHAWKQSQSHRQESHQLIMLPLLDDFCTRTVYLLEVKNHTLSTAAGKYRDGLLAYMAKNS